MLGTVLQSVVYVIAALGSPDTSLPAYAHNDYQNARPLFEAIELGFRGVEVDYFLIDGELRVGHERGETERGRTVETLYLEPLRSYIRTHGRVLPGADPFILNIESKESGNETYKALHELLSRYEDILTVVRAGEVRDGPVQVILVGWHPPLEVLQARETRYVAVQAHYKTLPTNHAEYPSHLLKLISQNYNEKLLLRGPGVLSPRFRRRLDGMAAAASVVPGRLTRVYGVPTNADVYGALLDAGVDLIGTKDIRGAAAVLGPDKP